MNGALFHIIYLYCESYWKIRQSRLYHEITVIACAPPSRRHQCESWGVSSRVPSGGGSGSPNIRIEKLARMSRRARPGSPLEERMEAISTESKIKKETTKLEWPVEEEIWNPPHDTREVMPNASRTVSVIIPVYNSELTLPWVLRSLSEQSYALSRVEVVIADDGSHELIKISPRDWPWSLTVVRQDDLGYRVGAARNLGAAAASGDILLFLDGDTAPTEDLVTSHMNAHHLSAAAVFGPRRFVRIPPGEPRALRKAELLALPRIRSASNFGQILDRRGSEIIEFERHPFCYHLFHGCNASVPRDVWSTVGGFDPIFDGSWGYEDTEFAYRVWESGVPFVAQAKALAAHLEDPFDSVDRVGDDLQNFEIACAKIPNFRANKDELRRRQRRPWW